MGIESWNWNLEIYTHLLSSGIFILTILILYHQFRNYNHKLPSFLIYSWVFFAIYCFTAAMAYLLLNEILFRVTFIFLLGAALFFTLGLDLFIGYSYDFRKMIILGAIIGGTIFALFDDKSVIDYNLPSGSATFLTDGPLKICLLLLSLFSCFTYFVYCVQIHLKSSKDIKKHTIWTLAGGTLFGIISPIIYALNLLEGLPGSMMLGFSLGALISGWSFALEPKIIETLINHSNNARVKLVQSLHEKLNLSQDRFKKIVETMNEIIYEFDLERQCIYANKAHQRILGYSFTNLSHPKIKLLTKNEEYNNLVLGFKMLGEGKNINNIQLHVKNDFGKFIPFLLNISPKFDYTKKKITGYLVLAREISNIKKMENILAEKNNQLITIQKMESLGTLAGGIAHDFNNLLQAIGGHLEFIHLRLEHSTANEHPLDPLILKSLGKMTIATELAEKITRNLLMFSRRQELEFKELDINNEINNIASLLKHSLLEENKITLKLDKDIYLIQGDSTKIQQIIMNLSINARDAMQDDGTIFIFTKNKLLTQLDCEKYTNLSPGNYVCLKFVDTGKGIADENIEHIFEPYFSTKPKEKGSGLGLSIVYNIVQQHNGVIDVKSEINKGTEFTIYFPAILQR